MAPAFSFWMSRIELWTPWPACFQAPVFFLRGARFHRARSRDSNDPDFASQWHLAKIQATNAWSLTEGLASVPIAIIDSGADSNQPDLKPKLLAGWTF
jgi:hypothetical protein